MENVFADLIPSDQPSAPAGGGNVAANQSGSGPFADLVPQAGGQPVASQSGTPTLAGTPQGGETLSPQRVQMLMSEAQKAVDGGADPATVNQSLQQAGISGAQVQRAAPQPEKVGGNYNNATAGINENIYALLGGAVDAGTWLMNQAAEQARFISGAPVQDIKKPIGGSAWFSDQFEKIGVHDPANVEAKGPMEKALRAGAGGAVSAVLPGAVVGALGRAGMLTPEAMAKLGPLVGDMSKSWAVTHNAALGAAGGMAGSVAGQAAEDAGYGQFAPLAEMAGGMAGGVAAELAGAGVKATGRAVGNAAQRGFDYVAPTAASQERVAGRILHDAATDPEALVRLDTNKIEIVPQSQPTTFQASGDMGLGSLERSVATQHPDAFNVRRAEQNSARLGQLEELAPDGAPDAFSRTLRGDVAQAAADGERQVADATARAAEQARTLGGHGAPEERGTVLRQQLSDAQQVARERERGLWQAVDPDGTLTIGTRQTADAAASILQDRPRLAGPLSGTEAGILEAARGLEGQPASFRELQAFRSRVSEAMREEQRTNGNSATYANLARMRGAIERDLEGAVLDEANPPRGVSLEDTWDNPSSAPVQGEGFDGPSFTPRATSAATQAMPDVVMKEAADIATGRRAPYRPPSFLRWIAARGGVMDEPDVAAALDAADRRHGSIISNGGRNADEWGETIAEHAGWADRPDRTEVLDWISEAANGREPDWWRSMYSNPDREEAARLARDIGRIASEEGIPLRSRRAALELLEQETTMFSGGKRQSAPPPAAPANFDADARARHQAASAATKERATTFRAEPVAGLLKTRGTAGEFTTPDAVVPDRVFLPGPKGAANVQTYQKAAGDNPSVSRALHETAVASMRRVAERPDGTIDPAKFEAWRQRHQHALRALPETDEALGDVARASAAVDDLAATTRARLEARQAGAIGKIMDLEDPEDVTRTVGSLFGRQDRVAQMKQLAEATAGNDEARQGLRKSIANHITGKFISNTEAGTSGQPLMKADQFQSFLRQNRAALAQVFSAEEMTSLKAVADDLQRSARSLNAVRIPGQSNTAQDMTALGKSDHSGLGIVTQVLLAGGASAFGGPMGAMASVMTTGAINAMRRRGMTKADDLVREALLDPVLAKGLLQKAINGRPNSMVTRRLMAGGRAGGAQAGASHDAQSGSGTSAQAAKSSVGETPDVILSATGKPLPDRWAAQSRLRALGHDLASFDIRRTEGGFEAVRKGAKTVRPIYDDMRTRLADAGMPEKELDANATIMEAYYKTRAGRLGVDAEQLYRESRPDVRAGESPSDVGEQLYQSSYDKGGRSLPASLNKDAVLQPLDVGTPAPIATHDEARASVPLGKVTNASGTNVEITKSTVKKWYSKGANETKRALAPHLVKAFENSVTYHEGSDGFSYAVGLMRLDGKDVGVRFVINGLSAHEKRLYQIEGIEIAPIYELASVKELGHRLARGPARKLNVSDAVDAFNKIQPGEFPLFQDGKRGAVTLGGERAVIELFKARDASTFMHEAGHVFLNDLVQDAAKAPAIKADLDAVSKWFGVDDASKITRQNHEQFAQGFEQYLRDGKAPNEGMKHAFDQFKDWLTNIYRSLTDLGQPIPANIRDVYDRMLSGGGTVLSATGKPFPDAGAAKRRLRATGKNPDQFEIRETENGFIAIPSQAVVRQVLSSTQEDDVSKKKQDGTASGAILSASGKPMPSKGAALVRLRALKLNPKDFEIRPVEGGFQAVPVR